MLTNVYYLTKVQFSILVNHWLARTFRRATGPRGKEGGREVSCVSKQRDDTAIARLPPPTPLQPRNLKLGERTTAPPQFCGKGLRYSCVSAIQSIDQPSGKFLFFQALLVFSRDTSVLKHFDQSSATPPKSYIRGEQKQFFFILIQHVTRFQLSSLHYICVGEFCLFALSAPSEFSMDTTVVSPPNVSQYFTWCKLTRA